MLKKVVLPFAATVSLFSIQYAGCQGSVLVGDADVLDGQAFNTWARTYGGPSSDGAASILKLSDGGYIVAGGSESFGEGALVLKLNASGNMIWQKFIGMHNGGDALGIHEASDGGIALVGRAADLSEDVWIFNLDASGSLLWGKLYGDQGFQEAYSIDQDSGGGYVVGGFTEFLSDGIHDMWLLKLDSSGHVLWDKVYGESGSSSELASSIRCTSDGGYIVAGESYRAGDYNLWILKLDSSGESMWQRTYGGTGWESRPDIAQTSGGGYVVSVSTSSFGAGSYDMWVVVLDRNGNIQWQRAYGGSGMDLAGFTKQNPDGGYILAGATESFGIGKRAIWVLRLDDFGYIIWQKIFSSPGNSLATSVENTENGGFMVAGFAEGFGTGGGDVWVLKLDENGEIHGDCTADMVVMDTEATVTDTAAQVTDTAVLPVSSGLGERESSAIAVDADCVVTTQCEGP